MSIDPVKPAFELRSTEILALKMIGASIERSRESLPRTIEILSATIAELSEEFFSIAGRPQIVSFSETDHKPCLGYIVCWKSPASIGAFPPPRVSFRHLLRPLSEVFIPHIRCHCMGEISGLLLVVSNQAVSCKYPNTF